MVIVFLELWIISIVISFVVTLFPIRRDNYLSGFDDVSVYIDRFIECFLIASTFVLIVSNQTHEDLINYQYSYVGAIARDSGKEPLYAELQSLSYKIGLNFFQFRELLVILSGSFAIFAIKKAGVKVSSILLFFLPVMMFMDSIQFRNEICLYVLLFAIHLLGDKKKFILFLVIIFALSQIHSAFYFYLILLVLFVDDAKKKRVMEFACFLCAFLSMITFANGNKVPFVNEIFLFFLSSSDSRMNYAFSTGKFGFLYPMLVHTFTLFFLFYLRKRILLVDRDDNLVKNIIYFLICSYLIVPFVMMNMNYYRILRNAYVVSLIAFMIIYREMKNDASGKIILLLGLIVIAFLWGYFILGIYNPTAEILDPILKNGVWFLDNETGVL